MARLAKRIIPCLDVKNGRTVKGVNFVGLRDAGDPVELAARYSKEGADELVFLDISASVERRSTQLEWVRAVAEEVNIPFTVGGGVDSVATARALLRAGADKVAVNSAAVRRPDLIRELSMEFGAQCVVLAVDGKPKDDLWKVVIDGGRTPTDIDLFEWCKTAEELGAGEILFTSMPADGSKDGFSTHALAELRQHINLPIIASGGAGTIAHFVDVFKETDVDAALAASVFHFKEIEIVALKQELERNGIEVRL